MGHQLLQNAELSQRSVAHPTWTFALPKNEDIAQMVKKQNGRISNLGRVMADRSTLYKYLSPHLIGLITITSPEETLSCAIYIVDIITGGIVYQAQVNGGGPTCSDIKMVINENTFIYTYWDEDELKGQRVVSVAIFEGLKADEKIKR